MRDRVDRLGVAEPEIRKQGSDQIVIQLPGVKDPAAAAQVIGKTAQLELYDLEANLVPPSIDTRTRQPIETTRVLRPPRRAAGARREGRAEPVLALRRKARSSSSARLPRGTPRSRKFGGEVPAGHKLFAVPPGTVVVSCGTGEICPTQGCEAPSRRSACGT